VRGLDRESTRARDASPSTDAPLARLRPARARAEVPLSELAFNYKGQRFAPPSRAVYWSVRRLRDGQRGQLDVVRDAHGLPLIVPIAIGIADFREAVGDQHGRYRLDALDADKMQIDGTEPAYVSVPQPRKVIEIEAGESADADLEHDLAVARDAVPVAGLRNAAMPAMVAPPTIAAPMVSSPIGTWPALPMPVAMSGEQYLVGEALRGLVQINMQQGNAHTAHLGQMTDMVASTLGAMQPLLLATNSRAERVESLLVELLLRQQGITPPSPPPSLVPPPAPPQPTPPPTPTVVYAMPRNAAFVDDDYDADEGYDADDDDLDDAPIAAKGEEDMIDKINRLVEKVATALAPVASVAQMVMGAGLGRGVFGGSDESPRNAAGDAPAGEPEAEADAAAEHAFEHAFEHATFGADARVVVGKLLVVRNAEVVELDDVRRAGQGAHLLPRRAPGSVSAFCDRTMPNSASRPRLRLISAVRCST